MSNEPRAPFTPAPCYATTEEAKLRERCRILAANCAALEKAWNDQGREIDELRKDKLRLDWISETKNDYAALQLPGECVRRNIHSMRAAIDDAIEMQRRESHNDEAHRRERLEGGA